MKLELPGRACRPCCLFETQQPSLWLRDGSPLPAGERTLSGYRFAGHAGRSARSLHSKVNRAKEQHLVQWINSTKPPRQEGKSLLVAVRLLLSHTPKMLTLLGQAS